MGVKTEITLDELNRIFGSYKFTRLIPTSSGIIDTTYIVYSDETGYILKKYERDISECIESDIKLLKKLKDSGLNTPLFIEEKNGWHLYEKLQGSEPKNIKIYHIQAAARFLARFHTLTHKHKCDASVLDKDEIKSLLNYTKSNYFGYYKKLESLRKYTAKNEGLIHGDIFKDNTVFKKDKIGVFDFIDSGCGDFAFDAAVMLIGFDSKNRISYINLFLNTYNSHAPRKISKNEILLNIKFASKLYALKRVHNHKSTTKAKELLR
jgi:homoserine kinase type II